MKKYLLVSVIALCSGMVSCTVEDGQMTKYQCLDNRDDSISLNGFHTDSCPSYPYCEVAKIDLVSDESNNFQVCYRCAENQEYSNDECIDKKQGDSDKTCTDDASCANDEVCKDGKCQPKEDSCSACTENEVCVDGKCQSKEDNPCSACAADEECKDGKCQPKEESCDACKENEDCVEGKCQPKEESCEACADDEICDSGTCKKCETGTHLEEDESEKRVCVENCDDKTTCPSGTVCNGVVCDVCGSGKHPENGSCADDTDSACGWNETESKPYNCTTELGENWKSAVCESGVCVLNECTEDSFKSDGNCVQYTAERCGDMDCTKIEHAKEISCNKGMCIFDCDDDDRFVKVGDSCIDTSDMDIVYSPTTVSVDDCAKIFNKGSKISFRLGGKIAEPLNVELSILDNAGNKLTAGGIKVDKEKFTLDGGKNIDVKVSTSPSIGNPQAYYSDARIKVSYSSETSSISGTYEIPLAYYAYCGQYIGYTGKSEKMRLPAGKYRLTVIGAGGGSSAQGTGGAGGLAKGILTLTTATDIYATVGGKGKSCQGLKSTEKCGGYNGGGEGSHSDDACYTYGFGGGGASDIRIERNTLNDRVIVAGGGGGAKYSSMKSHAANGGAGGNGAGDGQNGQNNVNAAATQTIGGGIEGCNDGVNNCVFGDSSKANQGALEGGGGGGWYAGMSGQAKHSSGAGGFGFVLTQDNYKKYSTKWSFNSQYILEVDVECNNSNSGVGGGKNPDSDGYISIQTCPGDCTK